MAPRRIEIAPDIVAEAQRLYEQTLTPVADIAAMAGISRSTFNERVREWKWTRRHSNQGPVDLARAVRGNAAAALSAEQPADSAADMISARRLAVAARIQGVVEREMDAVERVLDKLGPADGPEAERSARTLASLARTLHEIAALARPDDVTPPDDADDDPIPRDIDELQFELARRIRGLVDAERRRQGESADGPAGEMA